MKRAQRDGKRELNVLVTRAEFAAFIGVTRMQISYVERDGFLKSDKDGRFLLREGVLSYIRYKDALKSSEKMEREKKLQELKIQEAQLRLEQWKGNLLPKELWTGWSLEFAGKLHADYASVPARYTRDMKERQVLQGIVDDIHEKFCKGIGRKAASARGAMAHDLPGEAPAKSRRVGRRASRVPRNDRRARPA